MTRIPFNGCSDQNSGLPDITLHPVPFRESQCNRGLVYPWDM